MKFDIVPRFGEAQLFIFAASLIVTIALYSDLSAIMHLSYYLLEGIEFSIPWILSYLFVFLLIGAWLYGLFLSLKYALTADVPPPSKAGLMVWSVLLPLTLFSLAASGYWYTELIDSDNYLDKAMGFFPFIEMIRSFIIIGMMRMRKIEFWKKFDYRNANKGEVIAAFIVLLATGLAGRFLTAYSPVLVIIMMYEFANIAAGLVNRLDLNPQA